MPALHEAMHEVSDIQAGKLAIPKRYAINMKEIWGLQPRFEQRGGQRPFRLLENERYRAGYDFLLLRCESGELPMELAEWWDKFAHADAETRHRMLQPDTAPKKRRRRRKTTRPQEASPSGDTA
jgi:poly(A) polymerase